MADESDLDLIPRTVRDKLDRSGIKLHLKQWQALSFDARRMLVDLPGGSPAEVVAWAIELERLVQSHCGRRPDRLNSR